MTYFSNRAGSPDEVCLPCQAIAQPFNPNTKEIKMEAYPTQDPPVQAAKQTPSLEDRPTFEPPAQNAVSQGNTAWQTNKKVLGLWTHSSTRNPYMYVDQIGWRKFADNSDSAIVAFNVIAAHAKVLATPVQ